MVDNEWIGKCLHCGHSLNQEGSALICCENTVRYGVSTVECKIWERSEGIVCVKREGIPVIWYVYACVYWTCWLGRWKGKMGM